jgi:hypothetical protein
VLIKAQTESAVRDALDPRSERLFAAQKANRKKK